MLNENLFHPKIECLFTKDELALLHEKVSLDLVSVDYEGYINTIVIVSDILEAEIFIDGKAQSLDHALIANLRSNETAYLLPKEFMGKLKQCIPYPTYAMKIDE